MATVDTSKVKELLDKQQKKAAEANVAVIVGYTANYALWVHENLEAKWKGIPRPSGLGVYWGPKGQPKFLEEPARRMKSELTSIVANAYNKGASMLQSLSLAGLRLQRESQMLVPVETGNLRASAFTRKE